jgi:hypothetical protein
MVRRHLAMVAFAGIASLVWGAGCSSTPDDALGTDEGAATPANPPNLFAQAETCDRLFTRHESLRAIDMQQGLIRWSCADVPGVTAPDFGQEYCEYHAVQKGKQVNSAAQVAADGGKVSCVFTTVFTGAGQAATLKPAMNTPENLGAAAATDDVVQMKIGFNSRGAATQLFSDCVRAGTATDLVKRQRNTACYQAYAKGGPNAARLKEICNVPSISDAAWTEAVSLGAKIAAVGDEGYERAQDITSCMGVRSAGAPWRNSDPTICSRVGRTAQECGCRFNAVPNSLMGVPLTGWVNDTMPSSCRLAKVDGQDYPYIAICDLSEKEIADVNISPQYSRNLQAYCHDKYSVDLVLKLPMRDLQKAGTCQPNAGFCSEYMSAAPPPEAPVTGGETSPLTPGQSRASTPDIRHGVSAL